MDTITAADGTAIRLYDEGRGPAVLILGPGLDDGTRTRKLAALLTDRHRVLRLCRRQYRLDLKPPGAPAFTVAQEVEDVLAVAREVGEPLVLYGHSSGGVVALEALAADPSAFSGAVVFEPSAALDQPWTGPDRRLLTEMRAAVAAGRLSRAMTIFSRVVGLPGWQGAVVGALTALTPRYRPLVRCQVDDLEAMEALGDRLSTYAAIATRTILLVGERSPARLVEVVATIAAAMPNAERVTMPGRDHGADLKAPRDVAAVIRRLTP